MKNRTLTVNGTNYKLPPPNLTVAAVKDAVQSTGIIHGNMKDPNNWQYSTVWRRMWYGGEYRYYYPRENALYGISSGYFGLCDDPQGPSWDRTTVQRLALSKLNDKVRGDLDLGIDIAEWRQTRNMLAGLEADAAKGLGRQGEYTQKVLRYIRSIGRNSKLSRVSKLLKRIPQVIARDSKSIANGFLQYRYGWKPLLNDYYGAVNEEIRTVINRHKRVEARSKIPIEENTIQHRQINNLTGTGVIRRGKGEQCCTYVVHLRLPSFDLARWSTLNPIGLAWEVIPYSFVIDWFVDVGSYLRDLETAMYYNTQFVDGFCSELYWYAGTETVISGQVWHMASDQWYKQTGTTKAFIRIANFQRTKLTSYPLPNTPRFEAHLGSQRLLSAAALLRQLIRR